MDENETPLVLNVNQISWMVSLMFLGHVSSPLPCGYLMERFGRRKICLCSSVFPFTSWLLILYSRSVISLYVARYLAGLWIGVTATIIPIYVGEISGGNIRSSLITLNNCLFNFGTLFVYVTGPYVSYTRLAVVCELLTVVFFCTFILMPESPHYLIKHRQTENAFKALSWLRKGESKENIENEIKRIQQLTEDKHLRKRSIKDLLFDITNRKAFVIVITYALLKRLSGSNVLVAYASITLPPISLKALAPDSCVIIIGSVSFVTCLVSTFLVLKYDRRVLLTISCAGCALTTGTIAGWFYLNSYTSIRVSDYNDVIFCSLALYYCAFNIALGPVGTSIKGEVFSADVKSLSSSLTTLTAAISSFVMSKFYLIIAQLVGMYINFLIFSVSCVCGIVFTWSYAPDMHKRTLNT